MPGYVLQRFVNISPGEESELICSICQGIFNCPVVTQCCLQAFCEDCINEWLKTNNTCPYDKKTLSTNELCRPLRAFTNLLGKLKICCDFKEKGCQQILFLKDLTQHTVNCCYNPENQTKKCQDCLCEYRVKSGHDCIKALMELNKKANEAQNMREQTLLGKIRELEIEKKNFLKTNQDLSQNNITSTSQIEAQKMREQTLLSKICELETEKENFLKTIQDLSQNNIASSSQLTPLRNTSGTKLNIPSSIEISEKEIIKRTKKHLNNPEIIQIDMDQDKKNKVLSIVREQLKECNSLFDICKNITDNLKDEFGHSWNCSVSHQKPVITFCGYEPGHLLSLKFGELEMEILKTQSFNYSNLKQRLRNGKIKREIQITETDMKQNKISEVKKIIFEVIEKCDTFNNVSSEVQTQMKKSYPEYWQCFCFAHFGTASIRKIPGTYINFKIENLDITLFQCGTREKINKRPPPTKLKLRANPRKVAELVPA